MNGELTCQFGYLSQLSAVAIIERQRRLGIGRDETALAAY